MVLTNVLESVLMIVRARIAFKGKRSNFRPRIISKSAKVMMERCAVHPERILGVIRDVNAD